MANLTLSAPLQAIASRYVIARRRAGEALLDAAAALAEARQIAQHGEWGVFLQATHTSADTAERLLNIHRLASENPQFAEFIAGNMIGVSAAALLARPSTPSEAVDAVTRQGQPVSVNDVKQAINAVERSPQMTEAEAKAALAALRDHLHEIGRAFAHVRSVLAPDHFAFWAAWHWKMDMITAYELADLAANGIVTERVTEWFIEHTERLFSDKGQADAS
jgi:hypothetical protein